MIINIALGILLGFVLIIALLVILAFISAGFSQDKHVHIGTKHTGKYEETQYRKERARESHPEHWR